jgi:hypothetical protein
MKEDSDRKGDRSGGWVYGIFGFIFVGVFRAALAVVLIPLHTVAALCETGQTKAAVVSRVAILAVVLVLVGTGAYEINNASKIQSSEQRGSAAALSSSATRPPLFSVSVTETNRATTAALIVNGQETPISEEDVGRFALLYFNNPHDVMRLTCLDGQTLAGSRSSTGANVVNVPMLNQTSIELSPGKANNLVITCRQ